MYVEHLNLFSYYWAMKKIEKLWGQIKMAALLLWWPSIVISM